MYYVAVDIGCIECGEESNVLGIFTDKKIADEVCEEHSARQIKKWEGQHNFEVFKISELNEINKVEYIHR